MLYLSYVVILYRERYYTKQKRITCFHVRSIHLTKHSALQSMYTYNYVLCVCVLEVQVHAFTFRKGPAHMHLQGCTWMYIIHTPVSYINTPHFNTTLFTDKCIHVKPRYSPVYYIVQASFLICPAEHHIHESPSIMVLHAYII